MKNLLDMRLIKKIIIIITLIISFQSLTKADDIKDFQIEGMSIGDSLLDFFTDNEITRTINKKSKYKDKSFERGLFCNIKATHSFCKTKKKFEIYDAIQFHVKKNDPKFILYHLSGIKDYINQIDKCNSKKSEIVNELKELFPKTELKSRKDNHPQDKEKKSLVYTTKFNFKDKTTSRVQCYDWSKKIGAPDHLKVSLDSKEYGNWLRNKAWK
mgnify:FL=1